MNRIPIYCDKFSYSLQAFFICQMLNFIFKSYQAWLILVSFLFILGC